MPRRPHRPTSAYQWHAPLGPDCPDNPVPAALADPITQHYGIGDELGPDLEARHRASCERCQEYGAADIEVQGPWPPTTRATTS